MFIFTTCQLGAESALKTEITALDFRFAYSRPGFLTFKAGEIPPDFELKSIFTRAYGLSIGKAAKPEEIFEHAKALVKDGAKLRLHVWERDFFPPGDEPKDFVPNRVRDETLTKLRAAPEFKQLFHSEELSALGDTVIDLIYLDPDSWWVGYHIHTSQHSPYAGGNPRTKLPKEAPSRAYLKLEEAVTWSGAPLKSGDVAIEIGSAPGGASYALLQRGLTVVGIDPGEMAPQVKSKQFKHLMMPAAQVRRGELPPSVQWILLDMNVAPVVALNTVERIAPWYEESLLGVILTLKLNSWKNAEDIPKLLRRVEKLGMVRIRTRQLANNKQEICVVGLNRRGAARRK